MSVRATSCGALAAKLRAGLISSYTCASVRVGTSRAARKPSAQAAASPWPAECSAGSGTVTGWLAISRRAACDHDQFDIVTIQHPSEKVIGTTNMHAVNTMTASTAGARWSSTSFLWVWSFTGVGFPSFTAGRLFGSCSGCLGTGGTWTRVGTDRGSWRGTGNIDVTGLKAGSQVAVGGFWEVTLGGTGWGNNVVVSLPLAVSRCDNAVSRRPAGCVFSNIPGVVGFSQKTLPQFVDHVYGAQVSGLPGRLSTPSFLTRLTSGTLTRRNGDKACPPPPALKRPKGHQCDEYPFRSTMQGAYTSKATVARSLPWCQMPDPQRKGATGWSRCFIPSGQNLSAGGTLGGFYANERMLNGDPFQVGYLP